MKIFILSVALLLSGCMMLNAQHPPLTQTSRLSFDYNPAMGLTTVADANQYYGIITIDGFPYKIPTWAGCTTGATITCTMAFPTNALAVLNTIGNHTIILNLVDVLDPALIGPDSNVIPWNNTPAGVMPLAPLNFRILP